MILTDEIRNPLLKLLEQNPNLTQLELAELIGISLGKANYCINALIKKGWVKARNFRQSQNKLGYVYLFTAKGLDEKARITLRFLKIKQKEYDDLVKELKALREEAALINLVENGD
jgi:EPS-associated MarR family transcriptional regulator